MHVMIRITCHGWISHARTTCRSVHLYTGTDNKSYTAWLVSEILLSIFDVDVFKRVLTQWAHIVRRVFYVK